jgi:hypothetical protein
VSYRLDPTSPRQDSRRAFQVYEGARYGNCTDLRCFTGLCQSLTVALPSQRWRVRLGLSNDELLGGLESLTNDLNNLHSDYTVGPLACAPLGETLTCFLLLPQAFTNKIAEVVKLWKRKRTAYSDDGQLFTRAESLHCCLDLSLDSPIISNTSYAKELLLLLALLPMGMSYHRIQSQPLDADLAPAARAALNTSLAYLTNNPTDRTIRLLAPVAEYLRELTTRVGPLSIDVLRPVALSYFESCATLPLYLDPLASAKTPSDFLNVFEIFILVAEVRDQAIQDASAKSLLDLIERFNEGAVPDAFFGFLRKVRRVALRLRALS